MTAIRWTTIDQVIAMTDVEPARIYVDQGYRGHDYVHEERVFITRQRRVSHRRSNGS